MKKNNLILQIKWIISIFNKNKIKLILINWMNKNNFVLKNKIKCKFGVIHRIKVYLNILNNIIKIS